MALQKQNLSITFRQGLDTKTDPLQIAPGRMLKLENSIFTKAGLLQKRNGYVALPTLQDSTVQLLTTFNLDLTAIGSSLYAFSPGTQSWIDQGVINPVALSVMPLVRSSASQTSGNSAISSNGLICTVYSEELNGSTVYNYTVSDAATGQNIVLPAALGSAISPPAVYVTDTYFIILYQGASNHLYYGTISLSTLVVSLDHDIGSATSAGTFGAAMAHGNLYIAYASTTAYHITLTYLTPALTQPVAADAHLGGSQHPTPSCISITSSDYNGSFIYVYANTTYQTTGMQITASLQLDYVTAISFPGFISTCSQITATADQQGNVTIFGSTTTPTPVTYMISGDLPLGSGGGSTRLYDFTLASNAFQVVADPCVLIVYNSVTQPTYFLLDAANVKVNETYASIAKLAYSNGSDAILRLPDVIVSGNSLSVPYLVTDQLIPVNKAQAATNTAPVVTQTGLNLATFTLGVSVNVAELGQNLNIGGGQLSAYDGYQVSEQGFHLWPDPVSAIAATTGGGAVGASTYPYYYQVVYESVDQQGNIFRSAPSIPVAVTVTAPNNSVTVTVPNLTLTTKPCKIVIYRWSQAQPIYYQVTSITNPIINDPTSPTQTWTDLLSDSQIAGNSIIYTTGGVIENIGAPACNAMAIFKSRLFLVDAEDPNLLWYSKQVIEGTPVEMSDLLTIYVAPSIGAQGSTGPITALGAMDDKLIICKKDAIYYLTGIGPDNTGANNDFSDPTFITSTVGCANPKSIVFTPNGLIFQSDKGLWLLGRDLSTQYIGAPVEQYNDATVTAAVTVPGTNQVRFTLDNGITLMYDYFYGQWGTFTNVPAISSTLYQGLHTYINALGQVYQETPGKYLDGARPVLMAFTTGWLDLMGLQGFQRAYYVTFLGTYQSPHKLAISMAFDYKAAAQTAIYLPDNFNGNYGSDSVYGSSSPWGGTNPLEQFRMFLQTQKCQAFQISIQEIFDASFGVAAGAGLTISGMNLVIGAKKGYVPLSAARSIS